MSDVAPNLRQRQNATLHGTAAVGSVVCGLTVCGFGPALGSGQLRRLAEAVLCALEDTEMVTPLEVRALREARA